MTHLFVHRVFGVMRTHVFDEIVADFIGLARTFGTYRPDLALRFFGLEGYPQYRAGGRLEVYRPDPPLSEGAWTRRADARLARRSCAGRLRHPMAGELEQPR